MRPPDRRTPFTDRHMIVARGIGCDGRKRCSARVHHRENPARCAASKKAWKKLSPYTSCGFPISFAEVRWRHNGTSVRLTIATSVSVCDQTLATSSLFCCEPPLASTAAHA